MSESPMTTSSGGAVRDTTEAIPPVDQDHEKVRENVHDPCVDQVEVDLEQIKVEPGLEEEEEPNPPPPMALEHTSHEEAISERETQFSGTPEPGKESAHSPEDWPTTLSDLIKETSDAEGEEDLEERTEEPTQEVKDVQLVLKPLSPSELRHWEEKSLAQDRKWRAKLNFAKKIKKKKGRPPAASIAAGTRANARNTPGLTWPPPKKYKTVKTKAALRAEKEAREAIRVAKMLRAKEELDSKSPTPSPSGLDFATGGPTATLSSPSGVTYLDKDVLLGFPDLQLVTADGFRMQVNRSVLSATSPVVRMALEAAATEAELLMLEVRKSHLQLILDFAVTGCVAFGLKDEVLSSFLSLGIDINAMDCSVEPGPAVGGFNFMADVMSIETPHYLVAEEEGAGFKGDLPGPEREPGLEEGAFESDDNFLDVGFPQSENEDLFDQEALKQVSLVGEGQKITGEPTKKKKGPGRPKGWKAPPSPRRRPPSPIAIPDVARRSGRKREATKRPYDEDMAAGELSDFEDPMREASDENDSDFNYDLGRDYEEEGAKPKRRRKRVASRHRYFLVKWREKQRRIANGEEEQVKREEEAEMEALKNAPTTKQVVKGVTYTYKHTKDGLTPVLRKPRKKKSPTLNHFPEEAERDLSKRHQCQRCGFGCDMETDLREHQFAHDNTDPNNKWFCHICGAGFPEEEDRAEHIQTHRQEKLACKYCGKKYKAIFRGAYDKHMARHENPSVHTCATCGSAFDLPCKLTSHKSNQGKHHDNVCAYQDCGFTFQSWDEHKGHVLVSHGDVWRYKCGKCGLFCPDKAVLNLHKAKECQPEKFRTCEICGGSFKNLKEHLARNHTEKTVPCHICGKCFPSANILDEHVKYSHSHTACDVCGKVFANPAKVKRHKILVHMPDVDRLYKCDICGKGFMSIGSLREHRNIHTNLKPHKCRHCGLGFNDDSNRRHHEKSVHLGIKRQK